MRPRDRYYLRALTVREETYQEFLLKYATIEDKKREVIVKIAETQKTLVVCIFLSIREAYHTARYSLCLSLSRHCPSENTRRQWSSP
jgi:hypothetical protein